MVTFSLVFICVLTAVMLYVQAFKHGMNQKRWAIAGLCLGPVVVPMFSIQRQVALRQLIGFRNAIMVA